MATQDPSGPWQQRGCPFPQPWGPTPEYLECENQPAFKEGGFRRQSPAKGLWSYHGVGLAWQSDLDLPPHPKSLCLTPKGGWWASVRIQMHGPSAGLPPRTAASGVRAPPDPFCQGAGGPGVLSPSAPGVPAPGGRLCTGLKLLSQPSLLSLIHI